MAKRRTSTALARVVSIPRAPAPIIRVSAPRAPAHRKKHHRRRHGSGSVGQSSMLAAGVGGAIVGFAEKSFGASLPTIPLLGRKGVLAIGLYFFAKGRGGMLRDAAIAAAAVAGYDLGSTGSIHGVDGVVPQISGHHVRGIAAQV